MDVGWSARRGSSITLPGLLERQDGLVWVDIPVCDPSAAKVLTEVFGFHRIAVRDCGERNHVSRVHLYADHVFVVLHAPQLGASGHVHYVELDQFIETNYLVTVSATEPSAYGRGCCSHLWRGRSGKQDV